MFRPQGWLDRAFVIGILGKGLDGIAELLGGLLLLFTTPDQLRQLATSLTRRELSENPHDFIATHWLHTTTGVTDRALLFAAIYLLVHGTVKVVLVVALLLDKLWAYPWMITVLLIFITYQLYRLAVSPSASLIALTTFDVLVLALTWREYRQQPHSKQRAPGGSPHAAAGDRAPDVKR